MASTPDGRGYWLVASDGGIFTFGDAGFYGSTGATRLNQPVVGMASTPDGRGYWLVASDGGIFTFGDAGFYGSTGSTRLNQPIAGMAPTPDGHGYWLVAKDGGVFTFGNAQFHGSGANSFPANGQHGVGITSAGNGGYWLQTDTGNVASMDAPQAASSGGSSPSSQLPPNQDPSQSRSPSGDFFSACFSNSYSPASCDQAALSNIDSALAGEGYGPLSLPSNYSNLSTVSQLVAVANAERAVRGLPQMPENATLDSMAYSGARNSADPTGPPGYAWGSNLAMGYPTALSADYVWMYDDGSNSPNVDCQSPGDAGCWGHRHNVLIQGGGKAGGGVYNNNGTPNLTQLFVVNYP
jgi:ribosomal protein L24E